MTSNKISNKQVNVFWILVNAQIGYSSAKTSRSILRVALLDSCLDTLKHCYLKLASLMIAICRFKLLTNAGFA